MAAELEGEPHGWIPFVFLFAWLDGGLHPGASFSGAGPQVLYEFVQRLAPSPAVESAKVRCSSWSSFQNAELNICSNYVSHSK
jgi:hypothetical protein